MKIALVLFSLVFVQQVTLSAPNQEALDVSIVQLIANPNDYDGKLVRVIGWVRVEFEGDAIYLHRDDYKNGITKNGLWIDIPEETRKQGRTFDRKYVLIEGAFNAKLQGHMSLFSGTIEKIRRLERWR